MAATAGLLAIPTARDAAGRTWWPADIMSTPSGFSTSGLTCGGCPVPVRAIHDYRIGTGTIVAAHFGLASAGRGQPKATHTDTCPYNVIAAVEDLRRGLTVVTITPAGRERYQLVLPPTTTLTAAPGTAPASPAGTRPARSPARRVASTRPRLLNDLAKIVTLVHRYRGDPAAAALFTLRWGHDRLLRWDDFYYPPDRHDALVNRVSAAPNRKVGPVVVTAQITRIGAPATTRKGDPYRRVDLGLADTATDPVRVRFNYTPPYAPDLVSGQAVLLLGDWIYFGPQGVRPLVILWGDTTAFTTVVPDILDPVSSPHPVSRTP